MLASRQRGDIARRVQSRSAQAHYAGPWGSLTGAERLPIRPCDLLTHRCDLAQAADISADPPTIPPNGLSRSL
jgi:hypothetical protein